MRIPLIAISLFDIKVVVGMSIKVRSKPWILYSGILSWYHKVFTNLLIAFEVISKILDLIFDRIFLKFILIKVARHHNNFNFAIIKQIIDFWSWCTLLLLTHYIKYCLITWLNLNWRLNTKWNLRPNNWHIHIFRAKEIRYAIWVCQFCIVFESIRST